MPKSCFSSSKSSGYPKSKIKKPKKLHFDIEVWIANINFYRTNQVVQLAPFNALHPPEDYGAKPELRLYIQ
jgi:hypothetical protein